MTLERTFLSGIFAVLIALLAGAPSVLAKSSDWADLDDIAAVRLISAASATGSESILPFGLEFRLQPGWKIYWRTPGDAGLPPIPDWAGSTNIANVTMSWPVPERFEIFDIGTLGYKDTVVFPLAVQPETPGQKVTLVGGIDYLVCADICIPGRADLALNLPAGEPVIGDEAHLIDRYRATVPVMNALGSGLRIDRTVTASSTEGTVQVALAVSSVDTRFSSLDAFIEGPGGAYFNKPETRIEADGRSATLTFNAPHGLDVATLTRDGITATLVDGDRAIETHLIPVAGTLADGGGLSALWSIIGLALLGGLILNLMPCVLPVLSLKLISVIAKSGKESRMIRAGFLASSAGIITTFLLLAAGAIAVKQAGLSVGWGIQFQQPLFLTTMVALLTLFACNLLGLFEFRLPGWVSDRAANAGGDQDGLFRDFLTGGFATLLATPCSAPFLGTAVGFALGAGPIDILAVFLALGLGLAGPYLLVAAFPKLVRFLPRPGQWILYLKVVLAAALIGTALWLLSVLSLTIGTENAVALAALAAVAAAVLAARKLNGSRLGKSAWPISSLLAACLVLAPLVMTNHPNQRDAPNGTDTAGIVWQRFDEAAVATLVGQGKTVLVDVTADWCVTCQWNKKTVLQVDPVASWLAAPSVVAMQADWTRPDPVISAFLKRHGRYGIPFNIVYGPDAPGGIALPELLTTSAVKSAAQAADPSTRFAATQ